MPADLALPSVSIQHYRISGEPEILEEIAHSGVNLCVWERLPQAAWSLAIRTILDHRSALALDLTAPKAAQISEAICSHISPDARTQESVSALALDMEALAIRFGAISKVRHPRVRLTRVEDDGCALFHADTLSPRLLCTYAGPGTQWLENDNVRRDELGSRGRSLEEAADAIVIDPLKIRTLPKSHVAIFKGRLAEGEENNALVHRSSLVRHSEDFRLRLCIDLPNSCPC